MKVIKIIRNRFVIFISQFFILSLMIIYFNYQINIVFDIETTIEQALITQFLANLVLFHLLPDLFFIYSIWILVSLIPIFIYNNYKKAYSMNLITYFFPNFFLFIFLSRYSSDYFNSYFQFHLLNTILLGVIIIGLSIGISLGLKRILMYKNKPKSQDIDSIVIDGQFTCPNCGIKFESTPKYCYKCNRVLTITGDKD